MLRIFVLSQQLFDSLCATSHDELLLLKTFQNTHLNNCQTVKNEVNEFLTSIEKFIPVLQKSKVSVSCSLCVLHFYPALDSSSHSHYIFAQLCNRNLWTIAFLALIEL